MERQPGTVGVRSEELLLESSPNLSNLRQGHGSTFRESPRRERRARSLSCSPEGEREPGVGLSSHWRVTLSSSSLFGLALLCTFSGHKMQNRPTREKAGNSRNRILKSNLLNLRRRARQSSFKK